MRALTLHQPHASLIFLPEELGPKRIETRIHNRFRGLAGERIGIHAAARPVSPEAREWLREIADVELGAEEVAGWPTPLGAVLGTVFVRESRELVPTKWDTDRPWEETDSRAALCTITDNCFGLVLDDVFKFDKPVPAKGNRGIWHWGGMAEIAKAEAEFLAGLKGGA